jgi:hypothetical protein
VSVRAVLLTMAVTAVLAIPEPPGLSKARTVTRMLSVSSMRPGMSTVRLTDGGWMSTSVTLRLTAWACPWTPRVFTPEAEIWMFPEMPSGTMTAVSAWTTVAGGTNCTKMVLWTTPVTRMVMLETPSGSVPDTRMGSRSPACT